MMQEKEQQVDKDQVWNEYQNGTTTTQLAKKYGVSQPTISRWLSSYKNTTTDAQEKSAHVVVDHFMSKIDEMNKITDMIFQEDVDRNLLYKWSTLYDKYVGVLQLHIQTTKLAIEKEKLELKRKELEDKRGNVDDNPTPIIVNTTEQMQELKAIIERRQE